MLDIIRSYALKLDIPQMTIVGSKKAPLTNKSGAKIDKQATLKAGRLRKFETSAGAVGKAQKTLRSATATKEQRDRAKATIKRAAEKMRSGGSGIPFEKLHPRYPKGSPGGKGGKFMPKGSADYKAAVANNLAVEVASGKTTLSEARQAAKEAGITTKPELGEELGAMFKEADRIGKKYQDEPETTPAKKTKAKAKQPATDATSVKEAEAKPTELEASAKKAKLSKAKEAAKTKPAKNDLEDPTSEAYKARTAKAVERMKELAALKQNEPINSKKRKAWRSEEIALYEQVQAWQAATDAAEKGSQSVTEVEAKPTESEASAKKAKPVKAKAETGTKTKSELPKDFFSPSAIKERLKTRPSATPSSSTKPIKSYDDFKDAFSEAFDRINYEFNHVGTVPIRRLKEYLGKRIDISTFDEYLPKALKDDGLELAYNLDDNEASKKSQSELNKEAYHHPINGYYSHINRKHVPGLTDESRSMPRKALPKPSTLSKIKNFDSFKEAVSKVYDVVNTSGKHDNFVPIYKIRRALGDAVTRTEFNDYMQELHGKDFKLYEVTVEGNERSKVEDSVSTPVNGLRSYIGKTK